MEYQAPRRNFYALVAAILNPKLTSTQALSTLGVSGAVATEDVKDTPSNHRKAPRTKMPSREELVELRITLNQYEMAEHYKVSQCTISKWMALYSIDCNRKRYEPSKAEIERAYSNINLDVYEVAEELKVSISKLYELMKKHNIPINSKRKHIKVS